MQESHEGRGKGWGIALLLALAVGGWLVWRATGDPEAAPGGAGGEAGSEAPSGGGNPSSESDAALPSNIEWRDHAFDPRRVGGHLRLGYSIGSISSLHPGVGGGSRNLLRRFLSPPLVLPAPGPDFSRGYADPASAAALPEVSEGGLVQRWTLRSDLTWTDADGEEGPTVQASDFEAWFQFCSDAARADSSYQAPPALIRSVRATGPLTLEVRLNSVPVLAVLTVGQSLFALPEHALPDDLQQSLAEVNPPTHGPYRVERLAQDRITLVLRDRYRQEPHPIGPHHIERVTWLLVGKASPASYATLFRQSESDFYATTSRKQAEEFSQDEQLRVGLSQVDYRSPGLSLVAFNTLQPDARAAASAPLAPHPILGDVRVRRALGWLVDREKLLRLYFQGEGELPRGFAVAGDIAYSDRMPSQSFDPARAAAELDAIGWRRPEPGALREKAGQPLRLTAFVPKPPASAIHRLTLEDLKSAAETIGVAIVLEPRSLSEAEFKHRAYDLSAFGFSRSPPLWSLRPYFHSSEAVGINTQNFFRLRDPKVDAAIERCEALSPVADREAFLAARRAAFAAIDDAAPGLATFVAPVYTLLRGGFSNLRGRNLGFRVRDLILSDKLHAYPPR